MPVQVLPTKRAHLRLLRVHAEQLGHDLNPSNGCCTLLQIVDLSVAHQTNLLPCLDDLAETAVSESTSHQVLNILETVELFEHGRIAVGVADQVVGG